MQNTYSARSSESTVVKPQVHFARYLNDIGDSPLPWNQRLYRKVPISALDRSFGTEHRDANSSSNKLAYIIC